MRADLGPLLRGAGPAVQVDADGYAVWWTYAGGRINHTIKYALEVSQGWKVVAENFFVKIAGDGVSHSSIEAAVRELAAQEFWTEERLRSMRARIPPYRLSKFQDALPDSALGELLGSYFLDAPGLGTPGSVQSPAQPMKARDRSGSSDSLRRAHVFLSSFFDLSVAHAPH